MKRAALLLVVASALSAGCGDTGAATTGSASAAPALGLSPEQASRVVAKVGDNAITLGDYAATLDRMDPYDRTRYQTADRKRELLKEMIDLELLAIEAKRRGLDKDPAAQEATRQVLRDSLLSEVHKTLPTPTEIPMDEVKAYYGAHIEDYREPERRRVSAIVLDDEKKAKETLEAALATEDATAWGKLYFERSLGATPEQQKNVPLDLAGDLGIVGPPDDKKGASARVPEPVRAAVFKIAKVGQVGAELVQDGSKFYVVRLSGMTPGHERSLGEAERQIRVELLKQKMQQQEADLEAELRKKYKVEIDEQALAKLSTEAPAPAPAPSASASP
jgi:parvulin-like peptidyl-prolyl isomerase